MYIARGATTPGLFKLLNMFYFVRYVYSFVAFKLASQDGTKPENLQGACDEYLPCLF